MTFKVFISQLVNPGEDLNIIYVTETYVRGDEQSIEDIPSDIRPDDYTRSSEEHLISSDFKADDHGIKQDTYKEHAIIPDVGSIRHSKYLSSDALDRVQCSDSSETVIQNKSYGRSVQFQRTYTGEKAFLCSKCGQYYSDKSALVKHQRIHMEEKPFSCSECDKCFNYKSQLIIHERIHTGEKPFSCSECGKHFNSKSHVIIHERIHTGEKPYSCSECGKRFNRKSSLVKHERIHTWEKPYSCSECGKCFSDKSDLLKHEKIHTGEKRFSCSECIKCFTNKSHLVTHLKIHTGEKPFSCSDCGKCFNQKSSLVIHKRIHTGEKPFSCSECEKRFNHKSDLVKHERIHTGEKPYSCSECEKLFNRKSLLVKHERIHTGEKPYTCSECGKSFSDKSHLDKHKRIHTWEKPYSCSECKKSFNHKSHLVKHERISTEVPAAGSNSGSELTLNDIQLHLKSDFTPVVNHVAVDTFINAVRLDLKTLKASGVEGMCVKRNMKAEETKALKELSTNPCLTIKPADKGGAVVVMNTTDYVDEIYRQLNDENVYRRLPGDPKFEFLKKIRRVLDSAREEGVIDDKLHSFLYVERPRTPDEFFIQLHDYHDGEFDSN
ncbi:zinc finger protein 436-like [Bufo bufo]|uniref:zinc finger protein 436-like n=1 Tax=Bufo bufo TaxID=8384 RepID=UPI001ABE4D56|nr:zinc finger protein 436-like [Bufo bufo]